MTRKCRLCDQIAAERQKIKYNAACRRATEWGKGQGLEVVALYVTQEGSYTWQREGAEPGPGAAFVGYLSVPA